MGVLSSFANDTIPEKQTMALSNVTAWSVTVASMVFWFVLNRFIIRVHPNVADNRKIKYKNLLTSLIHAIVSASVSTVAFLGFLLPHVTKPTDLLTMNPETHPDANFKLAQFITAIAFGYFVYDMTDYTYTFGLRPSWDIIFHHIVVLVLFWPAVFALSMCGLGTFGLILEFNNVLLHERRLLIWVGHSTSSFQYRVNAWLNMLTFFILRVPILGYSFYVSILWARDISTVDPKIIAIYPRWVLCLLYLGIQLVNIVLFYRLLTADFLKSNKKRRLDNLTDASHL